MWLSGVRDFTRHFETCFLSQAALGHATDAQGMHKYTAIRAKKAQDSENLTLTDIAYVDVGLAVII